MLDVLLLRQTLVLGHLLPVDEVLLSCFLDVFVSLTFEVSLFRFRAVNFLTGGHVLGLDVAEFEVARLEVVSR